MDHKQSNRLKKREWIDDYFIQLASYSEAHNEVYGTKIQRGVIFMCTQDGIYQEFILEGSEFEHYRTLWWRRVEEYYTK
jgi:genome maintenance exonuclease 1